MFKVWVSFALLFGACDQRSFEASCMPAAVVLGSGMMESSSGTCDPRATATLQQIGGKTILLCSCPVFQPTKDMH